MLCNQAAAR